MEETCRPSAVREATGFRGYLRVSMIAGLRCAGLSTDRGVLWQHHQRHIDIDRLWLARISSSDLTGAGSCMRNTITVMNAKGGVGRSTLVLALAETLSAYHDKDVLIIDADAQASISHLLMPQAELEAVQSGGRTIVDYLAHIAFIIPSPRLAPRSPATASGHHVALWCCEAA
jgi:hypothetical protein